MFAMLFMPGPMEMLIIGAIAVLLFGNRLPKVARSVGSTIVEFKKGIRDVESEVGDVKRELNDAGRTVRDATKL